jgi:3-dehydroquinate dehydratase II
MIMASKKILVIHGPNLNMLGKREPEVYGTTGLNEINKNLLTLGKKLGLNVDTFQSNHEGAIIDKINEAFQKYDGLIINPGAYTHTSIAIRDALSMIKAPVLEVHLSNIYKREPFRHKSLVAEVATGSMCGFGHHGYYMALEAIARMVK